MTDRSQATKIWSCKIGETDAGSFPSGADGPMRQAISDAYYKLIGRVPNFIFSGWGGALTEPERAVVENREPIQPATPQGAVPGADVLNISPDEVGRIMHESWSKTKREQGFHHPDEQGHNFKNGMGRCDKCHADLISWEDLPEKQKDINRHAFDAVLAELRRKAEEAERKG